MTNSTTQSMYSATQNRSRAERKLSDAAPMVITRLSGWIDVGEFKSDPRAWIVPTRVQAPSR
jgi:hypothetical protein